jgi:hypothetical protein
VASVITRRVSTVTSLVSTVSRAVHSLLQRLLSVYTPRTWAFGPTRRVSRPAHLVRECMIGSSCRKIYYCRLTERNSKAHQQPFQKLGCIHELVDVGVQECQESTKILDTNFRSRCYLLKTPRKVRLLVQIRLGLGFVGQAETSSHLRPLPAFRDRETLDCRVSLAWVNLSNCICNQQGFPPVEPCQSFYCQHKYLFSEALDLNFQCQLS